MRWPVLRLIWLKLIFSDSEVAGKRAIGQVTRERRKKPFQLARGAIGVLQRNADPDPQYRAGSLDLESEKLALVALGTGIADRSQGLVDRRNGLFSGCSWKRAVPRRLAGVFQSVRVRSIPHVPVLLTFPDRMRLQQDA